jgi:hypothetical protein
METAQIPHEMNQLFFAFGFQGQEIPPIRALENRSVDTLRGMLSLEPNDADSLQAETGDMTLLLGAFRPMTMPAGLTSERIMREAPSWRACERFE